MKRFSLFLILAAMLVATLSVSAVVAQGNTFKGVSSTAGGYPTWDSDLINIEQVSQTGRGVYVAVLDTGLVPNWRDYFPEARVATHLGTGFDQSVSFKAHNDRCGLGVEIGALRQTTWVGSTGSSHGTHVASTILGYFYRSNFDAAAGFPLPPIMIRGIAPDVTIIPVKVLADYQIPALPKCSPPQPATSAVFGTSAMVAAGIDYVTKLALSGYRPMVINMSLGGDPGVPIDPVEKAAIDRAIAAGVIVVAAAGNDGEAGMDAPGSYAPVISAGAAGWTKEWLHPNTGQRYRLWWLQSNFYPFIDVTDPTQVSEVYVTDFSSRSKAAWQDLDVLAPGSWVRGPFPGDPGYAHLPWWSKGIGDLVSNNPGNFYYVGGTSMATPHVASVAALMLEKSPSLKQARVETILESTALHIPPGSATVLDNTVWTTFSWNVDATGSGLVLADAALAATP
ncbi:MAG: S8 family serine peptidase [Chloroflexi bacterium]|nr:S8 family serine peptidase [Chloroflexota bacterium]